MKVDQAIISSVYSRTGKLNQLIAKSGNIRDDIASALCRWSPCRNELEFRQSESVNFFPVDEDTFAIVRSFIGGQEHHRVGGRRIVSHAIVIHESQLAGYQNNVVSFYRVLQSMGLQLLQTSVPEELPVLDVPSSPFCQATGFSSTQESEITEKLVRAIGIHHQVIMVGHQEPLKFLEQFLAEAPIDQRTNISFATALNVCDERPFTLQFFKETDPVLDKEFASRQLRTISLESRPLVPN